MKTKKEFHYFTIFNHEKEEEYLREQHQHGWKFVRVTGLGMYHFEECEPEDVIYQLDFNEESKTNHASYVQMFSDCGWEYIQEYVGYSYFRKPVADMKDEEEIFCDESSRLAMLGRVFKRRMLPVFIIFMTCVLPQFFINFANGEYFFAALFGGIVLIYLYVFVRCGVHYYRKKNGNSK